MLKEFAELEKQILKKLQALQNAYFACFEHEVHAKQSEQQEIDEIKKIKRKQDDRLKQLEDEQLGREILHCLIRASPCDVIGLDDLLEELNLGSKQIPDTRENSIRFCKEGGFARSPSWWNMMTK